MVNNTKQIAYRLYARKSSETEDRQALSIESQIGEGEKIAAAHGVKITRDMVMHESKSAKEPYARKMFEELVVSIEKRQVQGIIAWHCNRLSRNAIDAARLIDLFDRDLLLEIVTQQQVFKNTPQDKFMLMLFCSQAKMENDNKGIDVKRGLRKKYEMGHFPGVAKLGYINDYGQKGERKILPDPERFDLVKQVWTLFLTGKYSVRKLLAYANDEMGLRTIQRKKEGGTPIKLSRIYDMLKDPYYAGFFFAKNDMDAVIRYEVNQDVPRMLSEAEFWKVQAMLSRKGCPRPTINKLTFAYTGRTKCGGCGGSVTAENKHQLICSGCKHKFSYPNKTNCPKCDIQIEKMESPVYLHYIYYHCTRRRDPNCSEGSVKESDIDSYVADHLEENLMISPALSEWCKKNVDVLTEHDKKNDYERKAAWMKEKAQKEKDYDELIRMKMKNLVDEDDFARAKVFLKSEIAQIDKALEDLGGINLEALEEVKSGLDLVVGISEVFRSGTYDEKVEALSALGSNLGLKDRKLSIDNNKLFSIILDGLLQARKENPAFEPKNCEADKDKTEVFASVCPTLLLG